MSCATAAPGAVVLALGLGAGVRVRCATPGPLAALAGHYAGWLAHAPEDGGPGAFLVECVLDAARCAARARETAGEPAQRRDLFALDTEVVSLPAWARDGLLLVHDAFCGCWYELQPGRVTVVAPDCGPRQELALLRVVRELACARTAAGTLLDLHAAALEHAGRAVLLCGAKRAGKSSLLCHLLGRGAAALLSNDRVQLRSDGGPGRAARLTARGIPTVVRLRTAQPGGAELAEPLHLSGAELCTRLGARHAAEAPAGLLLHLQIVPEGPRWSLHELADDEARARLRAGTYGVPRTRPTLLAELAAAHAAPAPAEAAARPAGCQPAAPGPAPAQAACVPGDAAADRACAIVAAAVPQRLCRLGPDAYAEPPAALLAALAAAFEPRLTD